MWQKIKWVNQGERCECSVSLLQLFLGSTVGIERRCHLQCGRLCCLVPACEQEMRQELEAPLHTAGQASGPVLLPPQLAGTQLRPGTSLASVDFLTQPHTLLPRAQSPWFSEVGGQVHSEPCHLALCQLRVPHSTVAVICQRHVVCPEPCL